jgi:hypothetical protein
MSGEKWGAEALQCLNAMQFVKRLAWKYGHGRFDA